MPSAKKAPSRTTKARKPTPKVSPKRGMSVEAWVAAETEGWKRDVVTSVLALAKKALPKATQSIKWGQPVIEQDGPVAYVKPHGAHVTFGLWRGAELDDPEGVLEGGDRMKHVKLGAAADVDARRFTAWLKRAAALNAEHGSPARRG